MPIALCTGTNPASLEGSNLPMTNEKCQVSLGPLQSEIAGFRACDTAGKQQPDTKIFSDGAGTWELGHAMLQCRREKTGEQ